MENAREDGPGLFFLTQRNIQMKETGKIIVLVGIIIVFIGIITWLWGDKFKWLGKLPGDIRIERDNFSFYAPITTMVIISIVLSGLLYLIGKFLK
ncbi:DUF2905 domain-containing protein [Chitinophaga caeni]|nr:DUF2905 domain-containing protein [Chitinophaga caeni]